MNRSATERGFSLIELLIVIIVISLLLLVAIDKLLVWRLEAERMAVQSVLGGLKSALHIEVAGAVARGQHDRLVKAQGSNPMWRLSERPDNYAGEFYGPDPAIFEPGTWYFDTRDRVLVYVVRFPEQFVSSIPGRPRARFSVEPDYDDLNRNGRLDPETEPVRGLRLVTREPFSWKAEAR